jgi:hypothetical protein
LSEEIKIKVQTDLYFREVVFLNLVNKAFKYINKKTFKLLAIETKAFVSYLEQWSKYSWPSGYKWNYNNKATTVGTVLHSLLNSNTETTFSYCLKLKRLENSISLSNSTGEYLESYTEVFRYRQLESDTYWQQFLQKLVEFITTDSSKITDTYLSHIGCKSVFNKNLIDTWSDFKEYNWFSSPEQTNFINKEANPNNLQQEDYYYLVYYPKQRFLDSKTKLDNRPILKTDFIKRPVPGFTYYLDCSEDINLAEDLDITVDSNYYIDPLRKYTGQITINVSAAPDCLIKALSLNTIAGVKKNIIYSSVYKIN